jgi:hypothetical protein
MPALAQSSADAGREREWHFVVLLDGQPIGRHDFTVSGTDDATDVRSHARFVVTVLRIPVYRYEHDDHEHWRGGCLAQIEATTSNDGQRKDVHGSAGVEGFKVSGPHGTSTWPGCVRSFGYWDRRILNATNLLNAETGEYEPVSVRREADAGDVPGAAERYLLEGRNIRIELWYSATGEWRALQWRTEQGRILRYEIAG